jgi:mannosyl-oligosaccharide glucosidase
MEWGTYKPNLFFGVKDRSPSPLTLGLAWAVPLSNGQMDVRHTYRYQSLDGVTAYFEYHDGQGNMREIINDPAANARIEIDMVKQVTISDVEAQDIESKWKALITIKPIDSKQPMRLVPYLYVSYSEKGLALQQVTDRDTLKTKVLKIMRERTNTIYEMLEVTSVPD